MRSIFKVSAENAKIADWLAEQGRFEMAVSREIRGSQEVAQNQRDIRRMIELGEKSLAFLSRPIFAPPTSQRFSRSQQNTGK
jgi:hypothetical protein